jgi:DNA-binding MarR family transcriptional regulator
MDLLQRELPAGAERAVGPNTTLDHQILRVLQRGDGRMEWTPREITHQLEARPQDVWRRLGLLVERGLVHRAKVPDGPKRGPGSHTYSVTRSIGSGTADES